MAGREGRFSNLGDGERSLDIRRRERDPEAKRPETTVTGLGGCLRAFSRDLPAGWGGAGPFRAQSIKCVSRSSGPSVALFSQG